MGVTMVSMREKRLARASYLCEQASNYAQSREYHRAIRDYLLALEIVEEWGTPDMAAALWHCLGSLYRQLTHYGRALQYFQRTVALLPETEAELRPMTLLKIGQVAQQGKQNRPTPVLTVKKWQGTWGSLSICC